jgi:hypothetical protein
MLITSMAYPHIANAIAKLEREGRPDQAPIIAALAAQRDTLDAEREAAEAAAPVAEAVEGHNGAPAASPFEAVKTEIEDLRVEAGHWLDGAAITSEAEAEKIGLLRTKIDEAMAKAEKSRVAEKAPFDLGAKEVQDRYNTLIGETKAVTGTAVTMRRTINSALTAWLNKVAAEQQKARDEAARIAREAEEKAREHISHTHDTTDLEDRESALREVDMARQAAINLGAANREKAQVQTAGRAIGLRTVYRAEVTDRIAALQHYKADRLNEYVAELEAMCLRFAQADVKAGKREIPGITVHADRVV